MANPNLPSRSSRLSPLSRYPHFVFPTARKAKHYGDLDKTLWELERAPAFFPYWRNLYYML